MLNFPDIATVKENPELLKITLLDVVKEIVKGKSDECSQSSTSATISTTDSESKVISMIEDSTIESISQVIDNFWEEFAVSKKLKTLHSLEKQSPRDVTAWRPTIGQIPELNIKGTSLKDQREKLMERITKLKTENEKLRQHIMESVDLNKYKKIMEKTELQLVESINTFEKIRDDSVKSNSVE